MKYVLITKVYRF